MSFDIKIPFAIVSRDLNEAAFDIFLSPFSLKESCEVKDFSSCRMYSAHFMFSWIVMPSSFSDLDTWMISLDAIICGS